MMLIGILVEPTKMSMLGFLFLFFPFEQSQVQYSMQQRGHIHQITGHPAMQCGHIHQIMKYSTVLVDFSKEH
mgnify:CR=1 FL=1